MLHDFIGTLFSPENCRGALANANGIPYTMASQAECLPAFEQKLVIGDQACANIDGINSLQFFLGSRNDLKIAALRNHCTGYSGIIPVGDGFQEHMGCYDGNTEPPYAVGLDGEPPLPGHGFYDGPDFCSGLHGLV